MQINKTQTIRIHTLLSKEGFDESEKHEIISHFTNDKGISTNDLNFEQANELISKLGGEVVAENSINYDHLKAGALNRENSQHRFIMSLLYQLKWICPSKNQPRMILDRERFGCWILESSAEKKPLDKLTITEISKVISQLRIMITKR